MANVYGPTEESLRNGFWANLSNVWTQWSVPWCLGSDLDASQVTLLRFLSDHRQIKLLSVAANWGPHLFRFENCCLMPKDFLPLGRGWWEEMDFSWLCRF